MEEVALTIHHQGKQHTITLPSTANLLDLSSTISEELSIPESNQKFILAPKPGVVKPPFASSPHSNLTTNELQTRKITLLGSAPSDIDALNNQINASRAQQQRRANRFSGSSKQPAVTPYRNVKRMHDETSYTFHAIKPLPHLPDPQRSQRFLERLANDAGIKASMAKHKFSVGLLTEMDPAEHTTHESRTLGLNKNAGEVILLRLRTDLYDGYRDYKTIRKTLCHELAHNVHSEHDSSFWALCREIEKEVDKNDWRSGGRALSDQEFYNPNDAGGMADDEVMDHGAWIGEGVVLGTSASAAGEVAATPRDARAAREAMARAAEERRRREQEDQGGPSTS